MKRSLVAITFAIVSALAPAIHADESWGQQINSWVSYDDDGNDIGTTYQYFNNETGQETQIHVSAQQNSDGTNLTSGLVTSGGVTTHYNQSGQEVYAQIGNQLYNRCGQEVSSVSDAMGSCTYTDSDGNSSEVGASSWAQY